MVSARTSSLLTLSDPERSKSLRFQSLISCKGAELNPMLPLIVNRKPHKASPMTSSLLTLTDPERLKSRSLIFLVEGNLHGIDIFTSSNITTLIWMSQKVVCFGQGFPLYQRSFLL